MALGAIEEDERVWERKRFQFMQGWRMEGRQRLLWGEREVVGELERMWRDEKDEENIREKKRKEKRNC